MLKELVKKNRSCRRFFENIPVSRDTLIELIDCARLSASASNKQPLKYMISYEAERNAQIFPNLIWAGALPEWSGPEVGERPAGYIIILLDKEISTNAWADHGIAAQSIMLGAVEAGLGGCMMASINKSKLRDVLKVPDRYEILLVVALGKPKEEVVIEEIEAGEDIKYWRDANKVHHVPKRKLTDIIIG